TVVADARSPIANVTVEPYESLGASASRVRIVLAQPVAHRVRSERNTVIVDFDKPTGRPAPYVLPPASRQSQEEGPRSAAPDAMLALQPPPAPAADPITALGLNASKTQAAPSPAPQPSVPQGAQAPQTPQAPMLPSAGAVSTGQPERTTGQGRQYSGH